MSLEKKVVEAAGNEEPEEEEEEELIDPQDTLRTECEEKRECRKLLEELTTCNDRVNSRSSTSETCAQELYEYVHCVDHCIAKTLFTKLK